MFSSEKNIPHFPELVVFPSNKKGNKNLNKCFFLFLEKISFDAQYSPIWDELLYQRIKQLFSCLLNQATNNTNNFW